MDGYSKLAPDAVKHKDLVRRQKLADQARPKPKASQLRFSEVADAGAAKASDADREAARQRWIDDMQAKADPKQIRRAMKEKEDAVRAREREEDLAKRQEFERQWYEREAVRQAEQKERTAEVNVQARQHWAESELLAAPHGRAEAVMPPEDVDFGAVRRRMAAAEERGGSFGSGAKPSTRTGALALGARDAAAAAALERQRREEQRPSSILAAQDEEYKVALMHDKVKVLRQEVHDCESQARDLRSELEACEQTRQHAEQRLARYGHNPKLCTDAEEASRTEERLRSFLAEAERRLAAAGAEADEMQRRLLVR